MANPVSLKVFVGADERASRTLTDVELAVMRRSLPGDTAEEKLDNLIDKVLEFFGATPGVGNPWHDYQCERTGKTDAEAKAMGTDALAALPDKA